MGSEMCIRDRCWVCLVVVVGTVNGFDGGDFQNGQQLSGNFTFTPNESMPVVTPEPLLPGVIGGWYRQGVGYQKVAGTVGL